MIAHRPYAWLLLLWALILSLACQASTVWTAPQTPSPLSTSTTDELTNENRVAMLAELGVTAPGSSPANPLPYGTTAVIGPIEITIREVLRGDSAWQQLHLANANNKSAPPGWEHLLLKIHFVSRDESDITQDYALHVTGDGRVVHFSFDSPVVPPEPWLETRFTGGGESEGWESYLIREGEGNLMLVIESFTNFSDSPVYLAIDEGASVTFDHQTMLNITPTDLGTDPAQPVPFGQTATGEDWQVIVLDVVSGEQAWQTILAANQFNDPPPDGLLYVLVHVRVRYIGLAEGQHNIGEDAFALLTDSGETFDSPSVVEPEPELYFDLYAGGQVDGWIVLQAPVEAKNLVLQFNPSYDNSGANLRYLSLGQGR
jgi:hypothetical protein